MKYIVTRALQEEGILSAVEVNYTLFFTCSKSFDNAIMLARICDWLFKIKVMQTATETRDILNDLILINNDRIAGYEKAIAELKSKEDAAAGNTDLVMLFQKMIDESREFRNALGQEVQVLGGEMAEGTMTSGKIYRAWMDVKALFTGKDRHAILVACETGEDAAQKAYKAALEEDDLPEFLRDIIAEQKDLLWQSHDEIKALRDQAA
jgi:uncharacterized protein (TIGR02284 family)